MADLISAVGESLEKMTELQTRVANLHDQAGKIAMVARSHSDSLQTDESNLTGKLEQSTGHIVDLERILGQASEGVSGRLGKHIKSLDQHAQDLADRHGRTRERLKALRTSLKQLARDVDQLKGTTQTNLTTIRNEATQLLAATAHSLDTTEGVLSATTRKAVQDVSAAVTARAEELRKHAEEVLAPRVAVDVTGYSDRISGLAGRLSSALQLAHRQTLENSRTQVQAFHKASATDWKGGSGDLDTTATQRSDHFTTQGQQKKAQVESEVRALQALATTFDGLSRTIREQHSSVHNIPAQIASVLRRVM